MSNPKAWESMNNQEVINEYKMAVENLPGSGASGRQWVADVEAELMERLEVAARKPETYPINKLHGLATVKAIEEIEKLHLAVEGVRPQNIAASIGYAVDKNILFNKNGTINHQEGGGR